MRNSLLLGLAVLAPKLWAGDFQNLDFQSADTAHVDPATGLGSASELLPGWEVSIGDTRTEEVFLNNVPRPSQSKVKLIGYPSETAQYAYFTAVMSVPLHLGVIFPPVSISQTGLVPAQSRFLRFDGGGRTPVSVFVNGVPQLVEWQISITNSVSQSFEGSGMVDISRFAGQEIELGFGTGLGQGLSATLDNVAFLSVPEPTPTALLAGASGIGLALRRNRNRGFSKSFQIRSATPQSPSVLPDQGSPGAPRSNPAHQDQNQHDDQHQAESAARGVAPTAAVRPSGDGAEQQEDEED